jgi:hypothetical protein
MPKQASVMRWVAIGAVVGAVLYCINPMPGGGILVSAATGLIGGGILGGFAAGIRNFFAR